MQDECTEPVVRENLELQERLVALEQAKVDLEDRLTVTRSEVRHLTISNNSDNYKLIITTTIVIMVTISMLALEQAKMDLEDRLTATCSEAWHLSNNHHICSNTLM